MGWCFYKHGILPPQYRKLKDTDKILMLSALEYFAELENGSHSSGNRVGGKKLGSK